MHTIIIIIIIVITIVVVCSLPQEHVQRALVLPRGGSFFGPLTRFMIVRERSRFFSTTCQVSFYELSPLLAVPLPLEPVRLNKGPLKLAPAPGNCLKEKI